MLGDTVLHGLSKYMLGGESRKVSGWAIATTCVLAAGCFQPKRTSERFEIPNGYIGWVRIDFDDPGGLPLPNREGARVIRVSKSGHLATSSHFEVGWSKDHYFYYSPTTLTELRVTGWGEGGMIWSGHTGTETAEHGRYHLCFFVGTEADLNAADARFNESVKGKWPVPDEPTPGPRQPLTE